jgi:membrane protease YdiL (CAAX protease family)
MIYWSCVSCFFYFVVPACVIKLAWKEKLSDYGFKLRGSLEGWPIYLCLFGAVMPLIVIASFGKNFQGAYPFYEVPRQDFMGRLLVWEIFYALQFISMEFFFRGFMVHGLRQKLGVYSIFAMVLPYCMIHFVKPLPELLGSIVAGVVLGIMSYRYRSILQGACVHIGVASSMDFLSLWHKGYFL